MKEPYKKGVANHLASSLALLPRGTQRSVDRGSAGGPFSREKIKTRVGMLVFCYRLILREETELQAGQGEQYQGYRKAVPRLWPAPWPRIACAGRQARWADGFKAESWYWGFAAALVVFAITLKLTLFFAILAARTTEDTQNKTKPLALRRFQPRRGQGGFHPVQQTVVIARDAATPDPIVVASCQQRRDRDRAVEAFVGRAG